MCGLMCVVAGCEGIDCVCVKEMGYEILIEKYEEECVQNGNAFILRST